MEKKDLSRFPKWLQEYVKSLENKISKYEKQVDEMTGNAPTNTKVLSYVGDSRKDMPLENNATIRFSLPDLKWVDVGIYEDEVRIYASTRLKVYPQAANTISLKVE